MNAVALENNALLQLTVRNHAGVLSHICGLFARRAYNIEALVALPQGDGSISQVLIMVQDNGNLDQIIQQTQKLVDVMQVQRSDHSKSKMLSLNQHLGIAVDTL